VVVVFFSSVVVGAGGLTMIVFFSIFVSSGCAVELMLP